MLTVILFFVILSTLVLVHEFGHFMAARLSGVKAEEFGFGFPPRLIGFVREKGKWKRVGATDQKSYPSTIWSINALPLGGFVRMKGEEGNFHDPDSFVSKGWLARGFILAAGVMMNLILAATIFSVGFLIGVPSDLEGIPSQAIVRDARVQLTDVLKDSGAGKAGIQPGDYLLQVNGQDIQNVQQAQALTAAAAQSNPTISVVVEQAHVRKEFQVTPQEVESLHRKGLGIAMANVGIVRFPWYEAVPQGVIVTAHYTVFIVEAFGRIVRDLFVQHHVTADVSGPVGIAVMTGKIAQQGVWPVLQFAAMLSLNLAVINFLPIPALDGGRFLFLVIESLRRRKLRPEWEANFHRVGFILLLALVAVVTIRDLRQYGSMIWHGITHVVGL